jgi:hypothetical protein
MGEATSEGHFENSRGDCVTVAAQCSPARLGSYHYARHRDENQTAAEVGNFPAMVFRHHRAVVTPDAATKFWNLLPSTAAIAQSLARSLKDPFLEKRAARADDSGFRDFLASTPDKSPVPGGELP